MSCARSLFIPTDCCTLVLFFSDFFNCWPVASCTHLRLSKARSYVLQRRRASSLLMFACFFALSLSLCTVGINAACPWSLLYDQRQATLATLINRSHTLSQSDAHAASGSASAPSERRAENRTGEVPPLGVDVALKDARSEKAKTSCFLSLQQRPCCTKCTTVMTLKVSTQAPVSSVNQNGTCCE